MPNPLSVLLVEDSEGDAGLILRYLKTADFDVQHVRVETETDMRQALQERRWDVVLSDNNLPGFSAGAALTVLQLSSQDIPFIIVSANIGEEVAVALMKAGAHDYVMKGNLARLPPVVSREIRDARERSEHRIAEEAWRAGEQRWKFALEGAGDGVWDWDIAEGKVLFSRRWKEMLGYEEHEIKDDFSEWETRVHPDDLARSLVEVDAHVKGSTSSYVNEFRMRCKDGSWRWILARGMVVKRGADGLAQRMIGTHCDVTERRQTEEALRELNEKLESRVDERTAELRQAMEQIMEAQKLASLGRLVAGVSHELNTPIGNIVLMSSSLLDRLEEFADAAQSGKLTRSGLNNSLDECRQASSIILNSARRAGELIESFKRLSVDQTSQRRRRFDLRTTVQDIVTPLSVLAPIAKVQIEVQIPEDIEMDSFPGHLEQVVNNLVMNSVRHGFEGRQDGHIVITARLQGDWVEMVYSDDGQGIAKEMQHRVFEPFYTTKLGQGGPGLGLSIVHNLIQGVFKGRLRLYSEPGKGVRFTFGFPAVTPGDGEASAQEFHP
jgi:PAS domain S-box-containing protein